MSMNTKANRKKLARALFSVDKNRWVCGVGGKEEGKEGKGKGGEGERREEVTEKEGRRRMPTTLSVLHVAWSLFLFPFQDGSGSILCSTCGYTPPVLG